MKIKKKVVIPIVAVLVVGAIGINAVRAANATPQAQIVDTYPVAYGELINSISVTGMVESGNTVNVYTTLSYPVQELAVEVGDVVEEGDLLCQLDAGALESTIKQNEATLYSAQAKANHSLAVAEKELENTRYNIEGDYNSQLLSAQSAVDSAAAKVTDAEAAIESAENTLRKMQHAANVARDNLRDLRDDKIQTGTDTYGNYISYDDQLKSYQQQSIQADLDVENAKIAVENAKQALETAKQGLDSAKTSQKAAEVQVAEDEVSTEDAVTGAKLNTNLSDQYIALEKLRQDLADATITSPMRGTVTAVFAKEGSSATASGGLLVVIEDTDDLKIMTKIKEYDIGSVAEGMPVTIKADGTGAEEYAGTLSKLAPTTLKDTAGKTVDTTSAEFEAEVKVTSASKLRIGMNARMSIITEMKQNVLSVPVEAITLDEDGSEIIFVYQPQEDGTAIARKVAITAGMENDFACEVMSDELKEGDEVITAPAGLVDGVQVAKLDQQAIQQAMLA